ncbi:hypothetical protein LX36DRAFT_323773 [Colletotrichum falcatum]|nr:hypothetical protein LX36DRAFT_323773 [Colletotrichum falcatum]
MYLCGVRCTLSQSLFTDWTGWLLLEKGLCCLAVQARRIISYIQDVDSPCLHCNEPLCPGAGTARHSRKPTSFPLGGCYPGISAGAPRLGSDKELSRYPKAPYPLQYPWKLPAAPAQISISGKLAGDTCAGRSSGLANRPKLKQLTLRASLR